MPTIKVHDTHSFSECESSMQLRDITLGSALSEAAAKWPESVAIICDHESLQKTIAEFDRDVSKLANAMHHRLDLQPGDRIAIWSGNCYNYVVTQYACARTGVVCWHFNPGWSSMDLERALEMAQPSALFCPGNKSAQESTYPQMTGTLMETLNNLELKSIVRLDGVEFGTARSQEFAFDDLVADQPAVLTFTDTSKTKDAVFVMLTSGSTGAPKAALLTHFGILNNNAVIHSNIDYTGLANGGPRWCLPLPFYHIFASTVIFPAIFNVENFSVVMTSYKYSARRLYHAMSTYNCSHLGGVPTMVIDTLSIAKSKNDSLPSWRGLMTGGAPISPETLDQLRVQAPTMSDVRLIYGSTEMTVSTMSREQNSKSVGKALDHWQLKVLDLETGKLAALGQPGLLKVRSPFRMIGYYDNDEKTREVFDDEGWNDTGDIVRMEADGHVYFLCRAKEVINRGGEKFYPVEIEDALYLHPSVQVAAAFAVPDARLGQDACAWMQVKSGCELSKDEVKKHLKSKMSAYKIPSYIMISKEGPPLTASGKISKLDLAKMARETLRLEA